MNNFASVKATVIACIYYKCMQTMNEPGFHAKNGIPANIVIYSDIVHNIIQNCSLIDPVVNKIVDTCEKANSVSAVNLRDQYYTAFINKVEKEIITSFIKK